MTPLILIPISVTVPVWTLCGLLIWGAITHSTPEFHGLAGTR